MLTSAALTHCDEIHNLVRIASALCAPHAEVHIAAVRGVAQLLLTGVIGNHSLEWQPLAGSAQQALLPPGVSLQSEPGRMSHLLQAFVYRRVQSSRPIRTWSGPCSVVVHERLLLPNLGREGAVFMVRFL